MYRKENQHSQLSKAHIQVYIEEVEYSRLGDESTYLRLGDKSTYSRLGDEATYSRLHNEDSKGIVEIESDMYDSEVKYSRLGEVKYSKEHSDEENS
ncbi:41402_t:CDS:2 [Gigaspora margarita]|uniref:41402_t:CDS:1 n=1 Tax=Gigaspora margarita TaxID=4874 RepID=A0ABN7W4V5_GIGMA|nr:41402_t:CDS:2 [Gigaspora margarita]